ncbi:MAG: hypothetical protein HYY01_14855 [Chloroflexi bacterium]|nr:hypothetical protein [Chloroflexota bacterium]
MLFLVTHTHTPDRCPADDPKPLHQLAQEDHARTCGVKVHGSYVAASEHTLYFALEAAELSSVVRFLRPLGKVGTARIVPIQRLPDALKTLEETAR